MSDYGGTDDDDHDAPPPVPPPTPPAPPGGWIDPIEPDPRAPADVAPPAPPGPDASPPTESRRSGRTMLLLGIAIVLAAIAGGAALFLLRDSDGVSHPEEWTAEVQPFVEVVEDLRDLEFRHPVHVDFLPEDEFSDNVTSEETELTDEEREELEQLAGMLRAVGLVEGELDLFDAMNQLIGEGALGFYSYEDERIRIRGEQLTPAIESTLVHELTHALQDQHFDLGARFASYEDADDSAGQSAFEALVEGDASRIETEWRATLPEQERAALDEAQGDDVADFEEDVAELPDVLEALVAAPYALGEGLLALAVAVDGNGAVDDLFADPPSTDEHLLDPWTLLQDRDEPLEVSEPRLEDDEEEIDRDSFGMLTWYLLLAERLDLVTALDAADGWGGDAYVGFERDGVVCIRAHYQADTPDDTDEMESALQAWIDALPGSPASIERVGAELVFESCDPGAEVDVGQESSIPALQLALRRIAFGAGVLESSGREDASRCFADRVVHEFTLDEINDPDFGADPGVQQGMQAIIAACI